MFVLVPMPCSNRASGYCRVIAPTEVLQGLPTPQLQAQGSAYGLTTRPDACALWGVTGCHPKGDLQELAAPYHCNASIGAGTDIMVITQSQAAALHQGVAHITHELTEAAFCFTDSHWVMSFLPAGEVGMALWQLMGTLSAARCKSTTDRSQQSPADE